MLFGVRRMMDEDLQDGGHLNPTLCMVEDGEDLGGGKPPETDPAAEGRLEAIKALRAEKQELAARLAAIEAEKEASRVKLAEEQGRYKELAEERNAKLTAAEQKLADYEARETARAEAQATKAKAAVEALPENLRSLVPEGLDADATLAQVERLRTLAPTGPTGTMGAGGGVAKPPEATGEEMEEAKQLMRGISNMTQATALKIVRQRRARNKKS